MAFDHHLNPKKLQSETSTAPVWSLIPAKNNSLEYVGQLISSRTEDNVHGCVNYIHNHCNLRQQQLPLGRRLKANLQFVHKCKPKDK